VHYEYIDINPELMKECDLGGDILPLSRDRLEEEVVAPEHCVANYRHSASVRRRREVTQRDETAKMSWSEEFAVRCDILGEFREKRTMRKRARIAD
jgi:hypothetical protein